MITIRSVEDRTRLKRLRPRWNSLLRSSGSDSLFMTWEWVSTWLETFGHRYQPLVLEAREGGELVGIAPLMIAQGEGSVGRHFRRLMFLGQNEDVTPEYLDFIIAPGREREIGAAFCDYLTLDRRDEWDQISLEHILASSPNLRTVQQMLWRSGIELGQHKPVISPFAALPGSWADYLRAKSKHFRKRVKYRERQLARLGKVEYLFAGGDLPLERAFDELVTLNRTRWGERGESFRTPEYARFHRELARRLLDRGWLVLVLMVVNGAVVAAEYDYAYAGKLWANQGGWLPAWRDKGVASVLNAFMLRWGIEQGYTEYDFLAGSAEYKEKWSTGERYTVDLEGANGTIRGQAFRYARRGKRALAGLRDYAARGARLGMPALVEGVLGSNRSS